MKVAFCCMAAASAGVRHGHEDAPVATAQAANDMAAERVQRRRSPAFLAPLEALARSLAPGGRAQRFSLMAVAARILERNAGASVQNNCPDSYLDENTVWPATDNSPSTTFTVVFGPGIPRVTECSEWLGPECIPGTF